MNRIHSSISILRDAVVSALFALILILNPGMLLRAQTSGTTGLDGFTPSAMKPGTPAGSYTLSGFDTVDLFNGSLNFRLPLVHVQGRGDAQMTMILPFHQKWSILETQVPDPGGSGRLIKEYIPKFDWWVGVPPYSPGFLASRSDGDGPQDCNGVSIFSSTLTRLTFTAADGTEYELHDLLTGGQPEPVDCVTQQAPSRGTVFVTADGTSATFISDATISDEIMAPAASNGVGYPSGYLFLVNGVRYRIDSGHVSTMRDRNGNDLTFSYGSGQSAGLNTITDSLGRVVTLTSTTDSNNNPLENIAFNGVDGQGRTVSVATAHLSSALRSDQSCPDSSSPPCTPAVLFPNLYGASTSTPFDPIVTSSVTLPDSSLKYQFFYNVYGELARVVLPTGGAIEYDYAAGVTNLSAPGDLGPNGVYRRVIERRVYADGVDLSERETFSEPENAVAGGQITNAGYVDVTHYDPANGNTVVAVERHYFMGNGPGATMYNNGSDLDPTSYNAWKDGRENETDIGSPALRRVTNTWTQSPPSWWTASADLAPSNNPRITETDTTLLDTGQVSKQAFYYDQYNNKIDTYEYDYGAGSPFRHTHTDYVTTYNGTAYDTPDTTSMDPTTAIHLRDLPLDQIVYDGSGSQASETSYEYDNYNGDGNHAPLLARSGISGIDPTFNTNARGNVTAVTRWNNTGNALVSYSQYDIAGNVVTKIDPLGNATEIDYSSTFEYAYPTTVTTPIPDPSGAHGSTSHLTTGTNYDFSTGKVVSTTDTNARTTSYQYSEPSGLDRLTTISSPDGATTNFFYTDTAPNPMVETRRDENSSGDQAIRTSTKYDGLGRVVQTQLESDPQGIVSTDTTYDALGRVHTVSNPYRSTSDPTYGITTYGYDSLSRVTSVTEPDGSVIGTQYPGNQTTVTDEAGKVRASTTDAAGRLTQVIEDPSGLDYLTTYNYDALDDLTGVHQGGSNGQVRSFVYDSLKRLTSATNPESGTISYQYDADGNLTTKTDARGITTTYHYDALNRLFSRSYSDGTPTVSYSYDAAGVSNSRGRLTQISSTVSATNYTAYDAMGRATASTQSTAGQNYTFSYGYDLAGNLTSETYPSGRVVLTGYNGGDRITSVQAYGGTTYASAMSYAPQGAVNSMTLGNGLVETTAFNNRLQPTSIAAGTLASFGYNYGTGNNNGNVLNQTITAGAFNATQAYQYDGVNRLIEANEATNWTETYGYDAYGNRDHVSSSSQYLSTYAPTNGTIGINANTNRITDTGFSYDPAGNLTQAPVVFGGAIQTYAYDAENKLVNFNSGVARYAYDGNGHRVQKTMGSATTIFVYDAMSKLIAEYSNTMATGSGTKYITADNLGSTRLVTDVNRNVLVRHDYLPFGEEIPSSFGSRASVAGYGATEDTRQKFTGKERDAESGLDHFPARYLTSSIGRWMSPDPLGGSTLDPQTLDKYNYVRNNAVTLTDPTGLYTADCGSGLKDCEKRIEKFDKALQEALKSKNKDIRKAAEAYGKLWEKNGVNVSLVSVVDPKHSNVNGITTAQTGTGGLTYDPRTNKFQQATQVTIKAGLSGDTLEETAVHEGVHVEDRAAFVASISLDLNTGATTMNSGLNITGRQSEINAFGVENIFRGNIGLPLLKVRDILAHPPYSDNPTLNKPLFPELTGGPPQ